MLKINVSIKNNIVEEIIFNGHAEFDEYGKDIVCAAASSMLITTVNAIISIDEGAIEVIQAEKVVVKNIKKDDITNKILNNLYELLKELENDYKQNIKIIGGQNEN